MKHPERQKPDGNGKAAFASDRLVASDLLQACCQDGICQKPGSNRHQRLDCYRRSPPERDPQRPNRVIDPLLSRLFARHQGQIYPVFGILEQILMFQFL